MPTNRREISIALLVSAFLVVMLPVTCYGQLGPYLCVWPLMDSWCGAVVGIDGIVVLEGGGDVACKGYYTLPTDSEIQCSD